MGCTYNILTRNCNHFSTELVDILFKGKRKMPKYINRLANFGSIFERIIPDDLIGPVPDNTDTISTITDLDDSISLCQ